MFFVIYCVDKPGSSALRASTRPAHMDYLRANAARIAAAGPFESDDGEIMTGSLLIVDMADKAEVRAFCDGDPYAKAGLFERVEIRRWKRTMPAE